MAAKYWIKLWHEILHDRKMAQLRDRLYRRSIECFLFAGELDDDGYLPTLEDMAWNLHADPEQLETELSELAQFGILQLIDTRWHVTNFAIRQAKMDKAEYMRRKRVTDRKEGYYQEDTKPIPTGDQPVTIGNADKIRIEEKRVDPPTQPKSINQIPLDPASMPFAEELDARRSMIATLSKVVRETYAIGVNGDKFEQVADALISDGIPEADVTAFSSWWDKQEDRVPKSGKPYLKSVLNNISSVKAKADTEWWKE